MGLEIRLPGKATDDRGGMRDVAGFDIGGGMAAVVTVQATAGKTTVNAAAGGVLLLAANPNRIGAKIVNNASTALHAQLPSGEQIAAVNGGAIDVTDGYVGAIDGYWEGSPTGSAAVTELAV